MDTYQVGMVGLGVMGANLLLNLEDKGFPGVGFDISANAVDRFVQHAGEGRQVAGAKDWQELVSKLQRPRRVFLMVPAGQPVDSALESLAGVLEPGDVIVDGGNSHYTDTRRREAAMRDKGLHFFGMGVSGGEEGALHGPSLMPGGNEEAYRDLAPALERIAAQAEDGPCVTYLGPEGAGHYVKMVHNGIEYGDMQLIAEAYHLLKHLGGLTNAELAEVFDMWNEGELASFLVEISARIFRQKDEGGANDLIDLVKDSASMKGTGKWTAQDAMDRGVAVPTIAAAVDARLVSARRGERLHAATQLPGPTPRRVKTERRVWVDAVRAALYAAKIATYAQGMNLLLHASRSFEWSLPLGEVARIWKAGCIIRARMLRDIQQAFTASPSLNNLLLADFAKDALRERQEAWRLVVSRGLAEGVALPAMTAALAYYDGYRTARLPANLVAAQRDLFGAHTYERLDQAGTFHTEWD